MTTTTTTRLLRCILTGSTRQARRLHANGSPSRQRSGTRQVSSWEDGSLHRCLRMLIAGLEGPGCVSATGNVVSGELRGMH